METLGPLTKVLPGGVVEQKEHWALYRHIDIPEITDDTLDRVVLPLLPKPTASE